MNFTDGRDPDLAIFCTVIRDKLYFQAVIREFLNFLYDYRENSLFWQVSFEILNREFSIFMTVNRELGDFPYHDPWFEGPLGGPLWEVLLRL